MLHERIRVPRSIEGGLVLLSLLLITRGWYIRLILERLPFVKCWSGCRRKFYVQTKVVHRGMSPVLPAVEERCRRRRLIRQGEVDQRHFYLPVWFNDPFISARLTNSAEAQCPCTETKISCFHFRRRKTILGSRVELRLKILNPFATVLRRKFVEKDIRQRTTHVLARAVVQVAGGSRDTARNAALASDN